MCENDILAIGALEAAQSEFGLDVPRDLAVCGFDDIEMSSFPSFNLTTYRQPVASMVDELVELVAGRKPACSVFLKGELVVRATT